MVKRDSEGNEGRPWKADALRSFTEDVAGSFEKYAAIYGIDTAPYGQQYLSNLEKYRSLYYSGNAIEEGKLVEWKPGMKNKRRPAYYQPAIVMEILPEPVCDRKADPDSMYYREPLDVLLGLIDEDGDFVFYHYDSHRFMPYRYAEQANDDGGEE